MTIALIFVIVAGMLFMLLIILSFTNFKNHEAFRLTKEYFPILISFAALFLSYLSFSSSESQGQKRPSLKIRFNCQQYISSERDTLCNYFLSLTNEGNIDAQVTFYSVDFKNYIFSPIFNEHSFIIPEKATYNIMEELGQQISKDQVLIAKYYVNYSSANGNGGVLKGDTLYCK